MPSSLVSLKSARARFFAHPRLRPFELVKPAKEKAHSKQRADSATVRERPEQFLRLRLAQSCAATNQQGRGPSGPLRSEEHTSELQSHSDLVCRLLLEKKKKRK